MEHNDHDPSSSDTSDGRVHTETFVFSGNGGPSFLATMQSLMNRFVGGAQAQGQRRDEPVAPDHAEHDLLSQPSSSSNTSSNSDVEMPPVEDPPLPELPFVQPNRRTTVEDAIDDDDDDDDDEMPLLEPLDDGDEADTPDASRPIRPLPRNGPRPMPHPQPHSHFHAHTPNGIIDLFTFSVAPGAAPPPPPPPGAATFTFNLGNLPATDVLGGLEAFFLGMPQLEKEREPDPERARVLVKGMEVVPEGLVKRLEHAGGVPGGHGTEENAGCAVCWGPLLDNVEPGEWDSALGVKDKEKDDEKEKPKETEDDELHGRIVALPCAHVYHAECLLPWFSRQTTCPTCRFDVDPDSLTWTPRPPRVPPPPQDVPPPPNPPPNPPGPQPRNPEEHDRAEQTRRGNAAEAARFNAFMNSILGAPQLGFAPPPHPEHAPPAQPQDQTQTDNAPNSHTPSSPVVEGVPPLPLPLHQAHPEHPPAPPNLDRSIFGSPPPLLPHTHFLPMPMFVIPTHAHLNAQGAPNINARPNPGLPHLPLPPLHAHHLPHIHHHPHVHPLTHAHPGLNAHPIHAHPQAHPPPRRERRKWTAPEPVGRTLRQRVEYKERELGLRCDDMVCGVAPSDEDPIPQSVNTKRVGISAAYDVNGKACEHAFHPACLVTSARVAGVMGEDSEEGEREDGEVQVACPACRAVGSLSRAEWAEGVVASEAEMA